MRAVIFNDKIYHSIKALSDVIGYPEKKVHNHLAKGSEVGNTGHCVDYAIDPEDFVKLAERNNKQN